MPTNPEAAEIIAAWLNGRYCDVCGEPATNAATRTQAYTDREGSRVLARRVVGWLYGCAAHVAVPVDDDE